MQKISVIVFLFGLLAPFWGPATGFVGEPASNAASKTEAVLAHDLHISYGQLVLEDDQAMMRIRLFSDDLEEALQKHYNDDTIRLEVNQRVDSLVTAYLNKSVVLEQNGKGVEGLLLQSGEDVLNGFPVWWFTLSYDAPAKFDNFKLINKTLMDLFDDQQNIMKVTHYPSEKQKTYYFTLGDYDIDLSF